MSNEPEGFVESDDSEKTPYRCLLFNDIPDSLPPGHLAKSLNQTINQIYVKLISQTKQQKTPKN